MTSAPFVTIWQPIAGQVQASQGISASCSVKDRSLKYFAQNRFLKPLLN